MSDMSQDSNVISDQMMEVFLFEMSSLLDQLDEILLLSEKNGSLPTDSVNEVFRIMHTIKGSSAMMDFMVVSTITHRMEDCFSLIRRDGIDQKHFTRLFDLMLDATDFLKSQLEAIQTGTELSSGNEDLVNRALALYDILNGKEYIQENTVVPEEAAAVIGSFLDSLTGVGSVYSAEVLFEEDCGMENLRAYMLVEEMRKHCHVVAFDPADVETNPETASHILVNGFNLVIESEMEPEAIQSLLENSIFVKSSVVLLVDLPQEEVITPVITGDRYDVQVTLEEGCGMENLRAFMLLNSLRETCNIISHDPPDIETNAKSAAAIIAKGFSFAVETPLLPEVLKSTVQNAMYVEKVTVRKPAPAEPQPAKEETAVAATPVARTPVKQNLINVNLTKLDELMDLMGELVITESMVTRSPDLAGVSSLENFNKAARQLRKLTDELQDMVMSIRMVPVAANFQKMQRIIRDMCRSLGKEAELVTMGEETDIDKTIIDGIADPIMHIVRNCMDHGVELPADRIAVGKSPKATITLSAQNTGGEILITVSDDGKGLDAALLLAKANDKGLLTKPIADYTEKEAFQLLMLPGFSTKEQVTEYSGRGVGMDVVKRNIESIGGSVIIESKKGFGMTVFLKIPLTLAIVDGMNVSVGRSVYTLQITAVSESFKSTNEQVQVVVDTDGNEMILLRGDVYPLIRLHELYGVKNAFTNLADGILIVVQSGDDYACLFVDQLIGTQQIVVKPLPVYLNRYHIKPYGISGCTILGDGNISLILDAGSIIDKVIAKK